METINIEDPSPLPNCLKVYFDGGIGNPNPGGICTYGFAIHDANGKLLRTGNGVAPIEAANERTNNTSEYYALGSALAWLVREGWKGRLEIYGDSQLIVNQINETWRCEEPTLAKLRAACLRGIERLGGNFGIHWIRRDHNKLCDKLATQARNAWLAAEERKNLPTHGSPQP